MADRFFGLDYGQVENDVAESATTPGLDVEIAIDLAIGMSKAEVLLHIDAIKNHIMEADWPPA